MNNTADCCDYYDCDEGCERLSHVTIDEAVEYHLDNLETESWPETLEVYGFCRMKVDARQLCVLDSALENLDYEYSCDDNEPTESTEKMRTAEAAFLKVLEEEYVVYRYDVATTEVVNVAKWVREDAAHWLENENVRKALDEG